MSVSVYPIYTVSKKAEIYHAMPSGEEKNGFREYVCYFTAPATTGEIRTSIGISGKSVCSGRIKIKSFDKKATHAEIIIPKPKGFFVDEVRSVPKSLAGYDDSEIERAMALIL